MVQNKVKGAAFGSVTLSVLAVILITTVLPLIMGGSVALAISFSDEQIAKLAPDNVNGYQWLQHGECTSYGSAQNTASIDPYGDDRNFTLVNPASGANYCNSNRSQVFELQIPAELVNHSESMSRMVFIHRSNTYGTQSLNGQWLFDYALQINGTSVFEYDDRKHDATFEKDSTHVYWTINFNHELNGIELMNLRNEWGKCEPDCVVTLEFTDIREGTHSGYDYQTGHNPFIAGKIHISTHTTDPELEGLVMTISPYIITLLNLFVAIGSTRLWQPLKGWIQ